MTPRAFSLKLSDWIILVLKLNYERNFVILSDGTSSAYHEKDVDKYLT